MEFVNNCIQTGGTLQNNLEGDVEHEYLKCLHTGRRR